MSAGHRRAPLSAIAVFLLLASFGILLWVRSSSGASPTETMDQAIAATHGVFAHCRPGPQGEPTTGVVYPPAVPGSAPLKVPPLPLPARCGANVQRRSGSEL